MFLKNKHLEEKGSYEYFEELKENREK